MDIQRLRNLTTGILHTEISHVYEDIEYFTEEKGIMTHMLPNAARALEPYLRSKILDARFWDDMYDTTHIGDFPIETMNVSERAAFWDRYNSLPSPFANRGAKRNENI